MNRKTSKGFTLLEILLVIAAIGILAAIVLVAINPNRQIAQARNAQRRSDVNTIYKALEQYLIEKQGYPAGITETEQDICINNNTTGCVNLGVLVPDYVAGIPVDPSGTSYKIGIVDGRVRVRASEAELGVNIAISGSGGTVAGEGDGEIDATDPDFASVSLLLHMDGSNGSTTFTDSSNGGLTATVVGSAQLSTAQAKFGTASANFNSGSNANITYTSNDLDAAQSEDFTWEFWAYVTEVTTNTSFTSASYIVESQGALDLAISLKQGSGGSKYWAFARDNSSGWDHQNAITLNQWQHIALVRTSNVINLYVDGVKSTTSSTVDYALDNASFFSIGPRQSGSSNKLYMDDFRATIGVARYTANFTPPTAPFPTQ
jgi:prepilin-type N-terminal cleavage/methylation domain-containing protein